MSPTSAFPAGAAAAGAAAGAAAAVLGTFTKSKLEAASNQKATMLDHWTMLDFTFSDQPYRNSALRTRQTATKISLIGHLKNVVAVFDHVDHIHIVFAIHQELQLFPPTSNPPNWGSHTKHYKTISNHSKSILNQGISGLFFRVSHRKKCGILHGILLLAIEPPLSPSRCPASVSSRVPTTSPSPDGSEKSHDLGLIYRNIIGDIYHILSL